MIKKWLIKNADPQKQKTLSGELCVSPVTAQILLNRGINTPQKAHEFLHPSLVNLKDPFLMKDMRKAVSRIKKAIEKNEEIFIHGDYDVDGICATALLELALKNLGGKITHYIPDRTREGYGVNDNAVKLAITKNIKLFISVDCGITAIKQTSELNKAGIDVIITDHHQVPEKLPHAFAILNPMQKDCAYPYKDLSGVGVVFKLVSALYGFDSNYIYKHLDLVALGTISDVVPLTGENRILVKNGLKELTNTKKKGLQELVLVAKLKGKDITSQYVGYILGPRINAAGRVQCADTALDLILTDDVHKAKALAQSLNTENYNRQKLEQKTLAQALLKVESHIDFKNDRVIVLDDESWHAGVIGIVASRLVERFNRPALIITGKDRFAKGSGRSIKNFHLVNALEECSHLLEGFGGHKYAAGVTLDRKHIGDFRKLINQIAQDKLSPEDFIPTVDIDIKISLRALTEKLFNELEELAPFGMGNPSPVFATEGLKVKKAPQIIGKDTIKMWVTDGSRVCEAIGYRMADNIGSDLLDNDIELAYTCSLNKYRGVKSIKLQLKDMRILSFSYPA